MQDPSNAALLAAKILGLADPAIVEAVAALQRSKAEKTLADDAAMRANGKAADAGAHEARA